MELDREVFNESMRKEEFNEEGIKIRGDMHKGGECGWRAEGYRSPEGFQFQLIFVGETGGFEELPCKKN